jgi:hypothetical protein
LPRTRPIECATVGWLLTDDDEVKVVCQNVGDLSNPANAQASGIMTIPARCVVSVELLTEVGEFISSAGLVGLTDLAGPAAGSVGDSADLEAAGLGRMPPELESLQA